MNGELAAAAVARCWALIFGAKHDLVLARAAIKSPRRQALNRRTRTR